MQSLAIVLGPKGITCNSVLPGTIATDINREDLSDPAKRAYFERRIPLGRIGEPDDIAGPVVFLASEAARYVNGAALLVDGGLFVNLQLAAVTAAIVARRRSSHVSRTNRRSARRERHPAAIWARRTTR
jgi:NAD(P)-dependent dehydrogenase (short-subunit alcohol dehydrogenase family)